jgi:hypothetical protein
MRESPPVRPGTISQTVPGPPHLRYYPAYRLIAWQPQGVLDDNLLDEMLNWLLATEKVSLPFKRYVDLTRLTQISLQIGHVFTIARARIESRLGLTPVRCALFCDKTVGFGIAHLYESLVEGTPIEARAFHDRAAAAQWLEVPVDVLALTDQPAPPA